MCAFVGLNFSNFIAVLHLSTINPGIGYPIRVYNFSLTLPGLLGRISPRQRPSASLSFIKINPLTPELNLSAQRQPAEIINPLKTKRRPLYLKSQFVPRSKHFSSLL